MVFITGEQLHRNPGFVRAEAQRHPVAVTYNGRPELVVLSVEHYELLRQNRKLACRLEDMPVQKVKRMEANRMDEGHVGLNALLDD